MCCRVAPSKNVRRGRPLRHSPVATRSRAAASRAAVARSAKGRPQQSAKSCSTLTTSRPPAGRSSGIRRIRGSKRFDGGALVEYGAPPLANLCLWPQGGHTSSRVTLSAAGVPPRPRSAPWPEAIYSGILTVNEVHTLPRASQDLVASFATSARSRHSRVSDKLKAQTWSGEYVSISLLLHDSSPQSYSVSVRPGSDDETPNVLCGP